MHASVADTKSLTSLETREYNLGTRCNKYVFSLDRKNLKILSAAGKESGRATPTQVRACLGNGGFKWIEEELKEILGNFDL
jgi:hypothetical protein